MIINDCFPRYNRYEPLVPVWCITPEIKGCIHRFFDTSPFSPSGRYLAVLSMPQEKRLPRPGEVARIIVIDLQKGEKRIVAETRGWETQMGANINWGTEDTELYFNDVDTETWEPFCVKLDPFSGEKNKLEGTIYRISPDGKHIVSADMKRMRRTQFGYGVMVPDELVPRNFNLPDDDGLYITDTETGKKKLLVSIREVFEKAVPKTDKEFYKQGECYGFHCKFNPQGERLAFSMRWFKTKESQPWNMIAKKQLHFWVVTMKPDGSDIYVAVGPNQWKKGGHHHNWYPEGKKLSMNLAIDGDGKLYFVKVNYDGTGLSKIIKEIPGSGHPTIHPDGRHILTDTYEKEDTAFGDGTVPLRLINLKSKSEEILVRINIANPGTEVTSALRVDPHPAWAPDYKHAAFNGFVNGTRRVFIADLSDFV